MRQGIVFQLLDLLGPLIGQLGFLKHSRLSIGELKSQRASIHYSVSINRSPSRAPITFLRVLRSEERSMMICCESSPSAGSDGSEPKIEDEEDDRLHIHISVRP